MPRIKCKVANMREIYLHISEQLSLFETSPALLIVYFKTKSLLLGALKGNSERRGLLSAPCRKFEIDIYVSEFPFNSKFINRIHYARMRYFSEIFKSCLSSLSA